MLSNRSPKIHKTAAHSFITLSAHKNIHETSSQHKTFIALAVKKKFIAVHKKTFITLAVHKKTFITLVVHKNIHNTSSPQKKHS